MAFTPDQLRARARRAYELGRLRIAIPWAILTACVGLLETAVTSAGVFGIAMSLLAAVTTVGCVWYGRQVGRGVWPGIWVGSLAMMLALVAWACASRGSVGFLECRLPCVIAGILITAGAVHRSRGLDAGSGALATLLATVAIATPLALIACVGVGLGGVLGLLAGLALGGTPLVWNALRAVR
jgi:hypothetical protein